jgi:4-amino-4-deoxy-L-arabinose transferase-like glycosyltransferase
MPRRELWTVVGLMALGAAVVLIYVLINRPLELRGDMVEYDSEGVFFTQGKLWWTTLPFGVAHEGMWKAPIYPAWVGLWYELWGTSPDTVAIVQALTVAPAAVLLTWLLGRRLFSPAVGLVSAAVVALFPLAWEYYGLLYPEALAVPLTLGVLILVLTCEPSAKIAIWVGALAGLAILTRPTSVYLFAGALAAWVIATGWRRGVALTAIAAALAALVILPWTVRNYIVADGVVPISIQDAAAYGTFNEESANDPKYPYAWRYQLRDQPDVLEGPPVGDAELRSQLQQEAIDYIEAHPESLVEAFFWNGLSRLWDIRHPGYSVDEAPFEGRSRTLGTIGIALYYPILLLALAGLWRVRRRRELLIPILALALAAAVVFTPDSGTRYRAPFEPLLVVLAASCLVREPFPRHTEPRAPSRA